MPKNISYLNKKIKLPDGWVKKSLGDIIKFHGGYVFSSKDYSSEGIPIIRISNITINGDFAYNFNDSKFCPYSMYKELKPFHLNKGDLIIALTDVSSSKSIIGRSAIIDNDKEFVMNQRVGKIDIIENQISKKFLHYYFNSTIFRYYVRKKSGKSAQANLSVNDLKKAEIVFPTSLREQNSISDFIMIMDNKVKLLEKKLKLYKKVFDKILFDSYNKNSNGHHFELIPLKNLCNIKRGTSPRPINDPKWFGNKAGWVRIKDITTAGKYLTKTEDYLSERGMQKSVGVNTGDIILSISSTLGKPVIAKMKACIHDGLVVFKNISDDLNKEYLYYFLKMSEYKLKSKQQTTIQSNLNVPIIKDLILPLPPLRKQREIVSILSLIDEKVSINERKLKNYEKLRKGISNKLLLGEITL